MAGRRARTRLESVRPRALATNHERVRRRNPLPESFRMNCPRCDCQVRADDASLDTRTARCRRCNEIFRFDQRLRPWLTATSIPQQRDPRLDRMVVKFENGVGRLSWERFHPARCALALCTAVFSGFWAFVFPPVIGPLRTK